MKKFKIGEVNFFYIYTMKPASFPQLSGLLWTFGRKQTDGGSREEVLFQNFKGRGLEKFEDYIILKEMEIRVSQVDVIRIGKIELVNTTNSDVIQYYFFLLRVRFVIQDM